MRALLKAEFLALLTEQGSLTDRMANLMGHTPVLNCLSQGRALARPLENQLLGIAPRQYAHVREIIMGDADDHWLFARTIIPSKTLKGRAKRLARMNNVPIGRFLFGSAHAKRSRMWVDLVFAEDEILAKNTSLSQFSIPPNFPLWQRRSIFQLASGPLMISEIFLPKCPLYKS